MNCCKDLKWNAIVFVMIIAYLLLNEPPFGLSPVYLGEFPLPPDPDTLHIDSHRLDNYEKIKFPEFGVEDVAVDAEGNIYTAVGQ